MHIRKADDDPTVFAPDPLLVRWRGWVAFMLLIPILAVFGVGLATLSGITALWIVGGREHVVAVWSDSRPGRTPFWAMFLLLFPLGIGVGLGYLVWHAAFFLSGFVNEGAFNRYFDLTKPQRWLQAVFALGIVVVLFVWLVRLLP